MSLAKRIVEKTAKIQQTREAEASIPDDPNEMLKAIDWKGLEAKVSKVLGTKITIEPSVLAIRGDHYIVWSSKEDLIGKSGVFKAVFTKVKVSGQGSSAYDVKRNGSYWTRVMLDWESKSGGSNGSELMVAWYEFKKGKWIFRLS